MYTTSDNIANNLITYVANKFSKNLNLSEYELEYREDIVGFEYSIENGSIKCKSIFSEDGSEYINYCFGEEVFKKFIVENRNNNILKIL